MAYTVTHSEPRREGDTFVLKDYDISMRENLAGISYADAEHLQKIENFMSKYRHHGLEGQKPKEGVSARGKER